MDIENIVRKKFEVTISFNTILIPDLENPEMFTGICPEIRPIVSQGKGEENCLNNLREIAEMHIKDIIKEYNKKS